MSRPAPLPLERHDAYSALRVPDFRLLLIGVFVSSLGQQMLAVGLGWELYNRTHSALVLGGIGLAQFIPVILLTLPAGQFADHYSRQKIVVVAQGVLAASSLALCLLSATHGALSLIYASLIAAGGAQAFNGPASSALVAQVVPAALFENAVTWRSSSWQLSSVLGPTAGGFLIGLLHGATGIYALNAGVALLCGLLFYKISVRPQQRSGSNRTWRAVGEGVQFLLRSPVILAAITLDLFAVLLGGATTLLPIFARDILHVGPLGLGWLQAAASLGAMGMALLLAHRRAFTRAGLILLLAVASFGLATIVFGLSHSFVLSFLALAALGACDNVSVVIRSSLVLVRTPDAMRGRVGAVNSLFIGASNQLGGFESGAVAQLLGPVGSVVLGGIGTVLVVALVAARWPELRRLRGLNDPLTPSHVSA